MLLVDTNVLLDTWLGAQPWGDWSRTQLRQQAQVHELAISPVVYAELAPNFDYPSQLDERLDDMQLSVLELSRRHGSWRVTSIVDTARLVVQGILCSRTSSSARMRWCLAAASSRATRADFATISGRAAGYPLSETRWGVVQLLAVTCERCARSMARCICSSWFCCARSASSCFAFVVR